MKLKFLSKLFLTAFFSIALAGVFCANSTAKSSKEGWQPLFNGKNLDGWYKVIDGKKKNEDPNNLIQVHNGMVHMYKDTLADSRQPFGYISTDNNYSNYHLRFEYKWGKKKFAPRNGPNDKRDAGTLYHVIGNDGVWPKSVECQVQEGDVGDIYTVYTRVTASADPKTTNLVAVVGTNAVGVVKTNMFAQPIFLPAAKGGVPFEHGVSGNIRRVMRNPMNEHKGWNTVEVIVREDSAIHIINGKTNNIANNISQMINGKWVPLTAGRITLQLEGAEVFYRNVEIRSLTPERP
ncbi:MAG: hypothetical protein JWM68_2223 [Verrucomicrobiales bacterium]|nr:hypothetical protein [Verrucomicrobiales bacterium]